VASQQLRAGARPMRVTEEARTIVVKLGGSVVRSPELPAWLDAVTALSQPVIVVPGGGALADEVRACQTSLGFGDAAAHRMALLAMDQLAWAIAGLRPGFAVGATEADLTAACARGTVAVWGMEFAMTASCAWGVPATAASTTPAGEPGGMRAKSAGRLLLGAYAHGPVTAGARYQRPERST